MDQSISCIDDWYFCLYLDKSAKYRQKTGKRAGRYASKCWDQESIPWPVCWRLQPLHMGACWPSQTSTQSHLLLIYKWVKPQTALSLSFQLPHLSLTHFLSSNITHHPSVKSWLSPIDRHMHLLPNWAHARGTFPLSLFPPKFQKTIQPGLWNAF